VNTVEVLQLRQQLSERDQLIQDLRSQIMHLAGDKRPHHLAGDQASRVTTTLPTPRAQQDDIRHEVEKLRQIVQDQGREADNQRKEMVVLLQLVQEHVRETQELRAKSVQFESTVAELQSQLELTMLTAQMQQLKPTPHAQKEDSGGAEATPPQTIDEERSSVDEQPIACSPRTRSPPRDFVDRCIQEYFAEHPEFQIDVEKVKPGWYIFGEPICKKLYLKVSGEHVVCRVGGGHKDLFKYLDEHRVAAHERFEQEVARARARRNHPFLGLT